MKKIGILASFLEPRHKKMIEETAAPLGYETVYFPDAEAAAADMADCEILYGVFPPEILHNATSLHWYACSWAGVDMYVDDSLYAHPDTLLLTSSTGTYGVAISEAVLMMILMLFRRMPEYTALTSRRGWGDLGEMRTIYDSRFAIIGTGDIGSNIGLRLRSLGASCVRGIRRKRNFRNRAFTEMYCIDDLDNALLDIDVLILCVPSTDDTRTLLTRELIDSLDPHVMIINVGRGDVLDQDALIDALNEGRLAGAALDVTDPEPLPADHPLWTAKNVLITPHVAGKMSAAVTRDRNVEKFCLNLNAYCSGKAMTSVVDRTQGY